MIVKVYSWIPRSYVHVMEVMKTINKQKFDVPVEDLEIDGKVSFRVKSYQGYSNLKFELDKDGLYSLSAELPDKDFVESARNFYLKAKDFILNRVIKSCHNVTYIQVMEQILPLGFTTVIMTSKKFAVPKRSCIKVGTLCAYYSIDEVYTKDSFVYVTGSERAGVQDLMDYFSFINISSHFLYSMMDKMSEYHAGTKEIIDVLENNPKSKLVSSAYLNLDLVKKDAGESWSKVEQMSDSLYRKKAQFESVVLTGSAKSLSNELRMNERFNRLGADRDYVYSLWSLLLNHLDNVDTAVEARMSFNNFSALKSNQWMNMLNSGFLLGALLFGLFILQSGEINNLYAFAVFVAIWVLFYELISLVLRR